MRRTRSIPVLVLLALLALAPTAVSRDQRTHAALASALRARIAAANLPAGRYGVAVLERGARPKIVFLDGHATALKPASVAKVLTAAAALDLLGPGHVFQTAVSIRGEVDGDGVLQGDVVVHGSGDPNLSGRFHDGVPTHVLGSIGKMIRSLGVRRVTGALVLDDAPFDRESVHPSWKESDRARWYGAGVSGLAYNDGCADVTVKGAAQPGAAGLLSSPSTLGPWSLENRVKTVRGGRPTVGGVWVRGGTALRIQGTMPAGAVYTFSHPVPDPTMFFGGALLRVLDEQGTLVEGGVRVARDVADRAAGSRRVTVHTSTLAQSLRVMNQRSQNFYASMLFKAAGAATRGWGTWESGQRAVTQILRRRGLGDEGKTRMVDGSGLSLENRTTAATVARVLVAYEQDLLRGPLLYDSLAVPGGDGTLRRRLERLEHRLHAKTGTLARSGVHAMAGYVDGTNGHPGYAFAILLNTSRGGRSLIDAIVEEIAR